MMKRIVPFIYCFLIIVCSFSFAACKKATVIDLTNDPLLISQNTETTLQAANADKDPETSESELSVSAAGSETTAFSDESTTIIQTDALYIAESATEAPTDNVPQTYETVSASTTKGLSEEQDYVLNTSSKKFHYPNCSSVNQMKDKNKQSIHASRETLIEQGYSPCGRCNP